MFSVVILGSCIKSGCTDPYSIEYDAEATEDDGSCSEVRNVKISIERTSEPTYVAGSGGTCGIRADWDSTYYDATGLIQSLDCGPNWGALVEHCHPDYSGPSINICDNNNSYNESGRCVFYKGSNMTINLFCLNFNCDSRALYDIKAYIGDNEFILKENYSTLGSVTEDSFNWIVP